MHSLEKYIGNKPSNYIPGPPTKGGGGGHASPLFSETIDLFSKSFVMAVQVSFGPLTFQSVSEPMHPSENHKPCKFNHLSIIVLTEIYHRSLLSFFSNLVLTLAKKNKDDIFMLAIGMLLSSQIIVTLTAVLLDKLKRKKFQINYCDNTLYNPPFFIHKVVNSYEDALQKAVSLRVVGALLDTNVVAHFQDGLFEGGLGIQQSIDEEQNVTILYLQSELKQITGAKAYIDCLDRTLLKHADALRPVLKVFNIYSLFEKRMI